MIEYKKFIPFLLISVVLLGVVILALFAADTITRSTEIQSFIGNLGYVGVILVAIIGGLNIFVPIPAVTLTPIFTASGLSLPLIILSLTVGTLIADYIGYLFGTVSRSYLFNQYPKIISWLEEKVTTRPHLLFPLTFLYAAFMPLPNEVIIIPFAVLGIKFQRLFLPLLLGNLVNQSMYAVGFQTVFNWVF
ncbi:MAG: hypothetical protein V4668_02855 [Patescibacteria group bacterium]